MRLPRIRLWHLFALITLAAVLVWLWPRVEVHVDHTPGVGSGAVIGWQGKYLVLWDTHPPAAVFRKNASGDLVRVRPEK